MDYCQIVFDGQPLSTVNPMDLVNTNSRRRVDGYLILGNDNNLRNVLPDIDIGGVETQFNSFYEVSQYLSSQRPAKQIHNDPTFPHEAAAQLNCVRAVMKAFLNIDGVVDGAKLLKQWETMAKDDRTILEITAWKFLKHVMLYHSLEGKLDPHNAESSKFKKWNNFAEHMTCMLDALTTKKTLCRHLVTDNWIAGFIDAPELHSSRVDNNRKINNAKRIKSEAGKAAIEHVKNAMGSGDDDEINTDDTQLKGLIDAITVPAQRKKRKNDDDVVTAKPRTRARSTSFTSNKKFIKSGVRSGVKSFVDGAFKKKKYALRSRKTDVSTSPIVSEMSNAVIVRNPMASSYNFVSDEIIDEEFGLVESFPTGDVVQDLQWNTDSRFVQPRFEQYSAPISGTQGRPVVSLATQKFYNRNTGVYRSSSDMDGSLFIMTPNYDHFGNDGTYPTYAERVQYQPQQLNNYTTNVKHNDMTSEHYYGPMSGTYVSTRPSAVHHFSEDNKVAAPSASIGATHSNSIYPASAVFTQSHMVPYTNNIYETEDVSTMHGVPYACGSLNKDMFSTSFPAGLEDPFISV